MALRTNSKKAKENIRLYIMGNFDGTNYDIETPATFKETMTHYKTSEKVDLLIRDAIGKW